ncbi:MAG: hypothetical protein WBP14_02325, partial [Candidatus Saccharimonas aalborgensis]
TRKVLVELVVEGRNDFLVTRITGTAIHSLKEFKHGAAVPGKLRQDRLRLTEQLQGDALSSTAWAIEQLRHPKSGAYVFNNGRAVSNKGENTPANVPEVTTAFNPETGLLTLQVVHQLDSTTGKPISFVQAVKLPDERLAFTDFSFVFTTKGMSNLDKSKDPRVGDVLDWLEKGLTQGDAELRQGNGRTYNPQTRTYTVYELGVDKNGITTRVDASSKDMLVSGPNVTRKTNDSHDVAVIAAALDRAVIQGSQTKSK